MTGRRIGRATEVTADQRWEGAAGAVRAELLVTGTTFGAFLPRGHPWRAGASQPAVVRRHVWGWAPEPPARVRGMLETGRAGEAEAVAWLERELGREVDRPGLLRDREEPRWGGSPDGLLWADGAVDAVVEVKTLVERAWEWDERGRAVVPPRYLAQAQWYAWLTGAPRCCFVQFKPVPRRFEVTWLAAEPLDGLLGGVRTWTATVGRLRDGWAGLARRVGEERGEDAGAYVRAGAPVPAGAGGEPTAGTPLLAAQTPAARWAWVCAEAPEAARAWPWLGAEVEQWAPAPRRRAAARRGPCGWNVDRLPPPPVHPNKG